MSFLSLIERCSSKMNEWSCLFLVSQSISVNNAPLNRIVNIDILKNEWINRIERKRKENEKIDPMQQRVNGLMSCLVDVELKWIIIEYNQTMCLVHRSILKIKKNSKKKKTNKCLLFSVNMSLCVFCFLIKLLIFDVQA